MLQTTPCSGNDHYKSPSSTGTSKKIAEGFSVSDVSFIFFTDEKLFTVTAMLHKHP